MARYAIVKDGVVGPVVEWDGQSDQRFDGTPVLATDPEVTGGYLYDGIAFTRPDLTAVVERDLADVRVRQAYTWLRERAEEARNTTVNNTNNTQVTQALVNYLGIFFDRFADLLRAQGRAND